MGVVGYKYCNSISTPPCFNVESHKLYTVFTDFLMSPEYKVERNNLETFYNTAIAKKNVRIQNELYRKLFIFFSLGLHKF